MGRLVDRLIDEAVDDADNQSPVKKLRAYSSIWNRGGLFLSLMTDFQTDAVMQHSKLGGKRRLIEPTRLMRLVGPVRELLLIGSFIIGSRWAQLDSGLELHNL